MYYNPNYVLVSDVKMLRPTLFTAYRILTQTTRSSTLHFWGSGLDESHWSLLDRLSSLNPKVQIKPLAINDAELKGAKHVGAHVTPAAMGRLLIPSKIEGRSLYLDGDVDVCGDLSKVFDLDIGENLIAGVKDFVVTRRNHNRYFDKNKDDERTIELKRLLNGGPISDYINSGVLLIDSEKIRKEPTIYNQLSDLDAASKWTMGDQDHINNLFRKKIHYLNPAWNASWGRSIEHRFLLLRRRSNRDEIKFEPNRVIHFHGANKPWNRRAWKLWKQYDRSIMSYRRILFTYEEKFPDLRFAKLR